MTVSHHIPLATVCVCVWGGAGGDPVDMFFVVFSYSLNFSREWHLRKFLVLGELSVHLFGLIFLCPSSEKMKVEVHRSSFQ